MAGLGFGFGSRRGARTFTMLGQSGVAPVVLPSAQWNGSAGSGFGGANPAAPVDPVRTTAKPICRLLTPPNQYFTGELVVGVLALANDGGSFARNLGLAKVVVHYEGTVHEIAAPGFYVLEDANGRMRRYFGWWAVLGHSGTNGHAQIYFEAIPRNPSMQRRVIGPYQFSPQASLHDAVLTVAPSQAVVAGSRYKTLRDALEWCRANSRQNPRITVTEPGTYDMTAIFAPYSGQGYATVEATVPITIGKSSYTTDTAMTLRPRWDGIRFRGENITLDYRFMSGLYHEGVITPDAVTIRRHWFDGCKCIDSGGRYNLLRKGQKLHQGIAANWPWVTECRIDGVQNGGQKLSLARGCTLLNGNVDALTDTLCVVDTDVTDWSSIEWRAPIEAMTVRYTGTAATATLALSGGNEAGSRTFTAKAGGTTLGTFTVQSSEAAFNAGTNYDVADVVAWLNSLPGFSATLLDDSRRATALGLAGASGGAFGDTDVKTASRTLVTLFDQHADLYQQFAVNENVVCWGMTGWKNDVQSVIIGANGIRDYAFVNCAFDQDAAGEGIGVLQSQLAWAHSHVVFAHCSWSNQWLTLRYDLTGTARYAPDSHCAIVNCTMPKLSGSIAGQPLVIRDNHLHDGTTAPLGSTGTTIGGNAASLFVNATGGDFTPQGALLDQPRPVAVSIDRRGFRRASTAPVGAITRT